MYRIGICDDDQRIFYTGFEKKFFEQGLSCGSFGGNMDFSISGFSCTIKQKQKQLL